MMKRFGFTLIEVNLAIFVMAVGVLSLVSLYSFGYRENQQSAEDVQAAAVSEYCLNAMVAALSSTNMSWTAWRGLGMQPANGWGEYAGDGTGSGTSDNDGTGAVRPNTNPSALAEGVFNRVMSAAGFSASFNVGDRHRADAVGVVRPSNVLRCGALRTPGGDPGQPTALLFGSLLPGFQEGQEGLR